MDLISSVFANGLSSLEEKSSDASLVMHDCERRLAEDEESKM